jgi:Holliday junction DNA helicase RuvB
MPNPETADQLRPSSFADFVGQNALRRKLDIHIRAAVAEERPLEHFLLVGAPGMGKTSLATVIAAQLGDKFVMAKMPLPDKALERIFRNFAGGVLFLDEIHNAPNRQQEQLMPVLEEGYFPTRSGQKILLPWITVIAATTEAQHVIPALYGRFDQVPAVEEYTPQEMTQIVQQIAERVRLTLSDEAAAALARAGCRLWPRRCSSAASTPTA